METFTTAEAAELAGVTVRQWHYWTEKHDIQPTRQLAGARGAKLWNRQAIKTVAAKVEQAAA